jgi:hypothetical protein
LALKISEILCAYLDYSITTISNWLKIFGTHLDYIIDFKNYLFFVDFRLSKVFEHTKSPNKPKVYSVLDSFLL